MKQPWLIQRARIITPLASPSTKLSDSVRLDYMGSSEFEFGALPESLRRFRRNVDSTYIKIVDSITENEKPLRVLSYLSEDDFKEYSEFLQKLRVSTIGTMRLKERTHFTVEELNRATEVDRLDFLSNFWWDIENDVMFSFHKQYMNRLPDFLAASFAYMDSIKR